MSCSGNIINAYTINYKGKVTLEVGANDGKETLEFPKHGCEIWMMEAVPGIWENLLSAARASGGWPNKTSDRILNLGLSNKTGKAIINIPHPLHGHASLGHEEAHLKELENNRMEEFEIETVSYKYLIDNIIKKPIDIIVLDIEGHEGSVLKSMKETLSEKELPQIICIECGYDWQERLALLKDLGYKADFFANNNCYLSLVALNLQKNSEFIRRTNQDNPRFEWAGTIIYKNHLI